MAYNTWAEYNVYGEAALTPVSATISFTNTISIYNDNSVKWFDGGI